jgi:PTH1 family peptidyl-tRNA hydrolase
MMTRIWGFARRGKPSPLNVVVGLGNPGPGYAPTRHNIGARAVRTWAAAGRRTFKKSRSFKSDIIRGDLEGLSYMLVLPQTFMNLSGVAVRAVVRKNNVEMRRLLVVHDDVALPLGTLRFKEGGSAAGHNGLSSLIAHLKTDAFVRLRIGIGPRPAAGDLSDFVLGRFTSREEAAAGEAAAQAREAVTLWLKQGTTACMNRYNRREKDEKKEREER